MLKKRLFLFVLLGFQGVSYAGQKQDKETIGEFDFYSFSDEASQQQVQQPQQIPQSKLSSHSQQETYPECPFCHKVFASPAFVKHHIFKVHSRVKKPKQKRQGRLSKSPLSRGESVSPVNQNRDSLAMESDLATEASSHVFREHPQQVEKFECPKCEKIFESSSTRLKHFIKNHPFIKSSQEDDLLESPSLEETSEMKAMIEKRSQIMKQKLKRK